MGAEPSPGVRWLLEPVADTAAAIGTRLARTTNSSEISVRPAWNQDAAAWRQGDRWRLPIPGTLPAIVQVVEVRSDGSGSVHVRGRLEGDAGSGIRMVFREGGMAGVVRRGNGTRFVVAPDPSGGHRISAWEGDEHVRCGNAGPGVGGHDHGAENVRFQAEPLKAGGLGGDSTGIPATRRLHAAGGSGAPYEVDLLVGHTPAATAGAGGEAGIRMLVELAVAESNDAFERSDVRVRLRLVGLVSVDYVESGELRTDLTRLTRADDGWMDEVQRLRDSHAADIVCLVTESEKSNQFAGMANQLRNVEVPSLQMGYTVCLRPYLLGNYTLAHEIGHLLGANHDRDTSPEGGLLNGAYGARFVVDRQTYRTVMAYRPGIQIPHFSNPTVAYRDVPTGVGGVTDNASTLNYVAPKVSAVREPASRLGFGTGGITIDENAGTVQLRLIRTGALTPGTVRVRTVDGSARAGVDYEAVDRVIALPAEGATAEVPVNLRDNAQQDGHRQFSMSLSESTPGLAIGPAAMVLLTLRDDESDQGLLLDTSFRARPGADYVVRALAPMRPGNGEVIVGGGFATYDGMDRPRVARVRTDGTVAPDFRVKVKYEVNTVLRMPDGRVLLGGEFNTVNDVRLNHVAVLLPSGEPDPEFVFETGTDLVVHALALAPEDKVVVGGEFTSVQGVTALRLARITLDGDIDTSFDTRSAADGPVYAVAVDAVGRPIAGGSFGRVEGQARGGVARWLNSGRLDQGFATGGGANGPVLALAVDVQGRILVAGEFTRFDGQAAGRVVRLTEAGELDRTFRASGGSGADDAILSVLARHDGTLWVAGKFVSMDGLARSRVARLKDDGTVDPAFDPGRGPNDWVLALAERDDGGLVLGGVFTEVMGVPRGGLAVLLPSAPGPVRFGWAGWGAIGLRWSAEAWPRQSYAVEQSTDFVDWLRVDTVGAPDGRLGGTVPAAGGSAGFVRLRRLLE